VELSVAPAALGAAGRALLLAFSMFWEVLWPLALGFLLSAVVQALVPQRTVAALLGRPDARGIALACGFGAASSSCSYAAVAVARALFRKGAAFTNAIVFEFASTNLVFELGLVLLVLLGWRFWAAEVAGGLIMVGILAVALRWTLSRRMVEGARAQAERGLAGRMEGHGEMDMSVSGGALARRLFSGPALTAIAQYFYMDLASLWQDLLLGFLIAGALAAWVPDAFWRAFFLADHPALATYWGPLVGPLISMISFVCSVGNVPLAAVLWNGGISFGGVISFIFADLIILPIVNIHRRYYGGRASLYLLVVSYLAMSAAGLLVELAFRALGLEPAHFPVRALQSLPAWDYTTYLDLGALALAAVLGWRFLATGGVGMLRMMNARPAPRPSTGGT
jgi:uncharacterized membrane protein YraQ (UPF0718 family)